MCRSLPPPSSRPPLPSPAAEAEGASRRARLLVAPAAAGSRRRRGAAPRSRPSRGRPAATAGAAAASGGGRRNRSRLRSLRCGAGVGGAATAAGDDDDDGARGRGGDRCGRGSRLRFGRCGSRARREEWHTRLLVDGLLPATKRRAAFTRYFASSSVVSGRHFLDQREHPLPNAKCQTSNRQSQRQTPSS